MLPPILRGEPAAALEEVTAGAALPLVALVADARLEVGVVTVVPNPELVLATGVEEAEAEDVFVKVEEPL